MKKSLFVVFGLVIATAAYAAEFGILDFNFVAPAVPSTSSAPNQVGLIVYDTTNKVFWGRSSDVAPNEWQMLSPPVTQLVPAGTILPFAGTVAPEGYLMADGAVVSRSTYAGLFAVVGTAFGAGNGSTTFALPDLRGRFLRGVDGGAGRDPDSAARTAMSSGGNTADMVGSVQLDAFKSHTHGPGAGATGFQGTGGTGPSTANGGAASFSETGATGGSETRPLNVYVNYIIKI